MHAVTLLAVLFLWTLVHSALCTNDPKARSAAEYNLHHYTTSWESIVNGHDKPETDTNKNFKGTTLAYVTPWNSKGYHVASQFCCKFDILAPTWYNFGRDKTGPFVRGRENARPAWIRKILSSAHQQCKSRGRPKITPRFLLEGGWDHTILAKTFDSRRTSQKLVELMMAEVKHFNFSGIVIDASHFDAKSTAKPPFLDFLNSLANQLKKSNGQLILAIANDQRLFDHEDLVEFEPFVDYFSLMTYDYSSPRKPGPSSPHEWALSIVKRLQGKDKTHSKKILMGVNLYGYDFIAALHQGQPILADKVVELLREKEPIVKWHPTYREHYFNYERTQLIHTVWFPTPQYLKNKVQLAEELDCGLSLWEIGQSMNSLYSVL
ncbi:chitinase domain-containing protein 1-like [Schistocerca gregaria]|uniref:chitinase domain-containing protein 1-like n=1 Tax=Schistocerca gregaria TaxID=7010 RepID=UPI00211E5833|nr:chitinase domain-containing protein 1-like [Schistocerca gregaria]